MKTKPVILFSLILFSAYIITAQNTMTIKAAYDAALGYHTGYSSHANTNYSTVTANPAFIIPGASSGTNGNRALIWFDLTQIPVCAIITSATLDLYAHGPHGTLSGHTGTNNSVALRRVTQAWNVNTVTWNNQPTSTTQNEAILPPSTSATQNYLNIPVTQLVLDMINTNNYGFLLRLVNEVTTNAMVFTSVDHVDTLKHPRLTINYTLHGDPCPSYVFNQISICEGDSAFLQNDYQKATGLYFDTLVNFQNVDSVIVTALTVYAPLNIIKTHTICNGDSLWLEGAYRKIPGFYPELYTGINGCDSNIYNQLFITVIDTSISVNGVTLTANQGGATYQWIDCEVGFSPIPGATSQSFTPAVNGSYAVIITKDGCIAISPCIRVGNIKSSEQENKHGFKIYPNPAGENINVFIDQKFRHASYTIKSLSGQEISGTSLTRNPQEIDLKGISKGVYLMQLNIDSRIMTKKILIE